MPSQEDIDKQQELLSAHRATLAILLAQQVRHTKAYTPPATEHGIHEARANIRRVKKILSGWGVLVADHPDDESTQDNTDPPRQTSPLKPSISQLDIFLSLTTTVFVVGMISIIIFLWQKDQERKCLHEIFPNAPSTFYIGFYSSNGKANYRAVCDETSDGRKDYLVISLQPYRKDAEAGLILILKGFEAQNYEGLSFWVKGSHGDENFAMKMKNTLGQEETIWRTGNTNGEDVNTTWQRIVISRQRFLGTSELPLESITFFTTGDISGTEEQQFYISQIEFY